MGPGKVVIVAVACAALGGVAGAVAVDALSIPGAGTEHTVLEVEKLRVEREDLIQRIETLEERAPRTTARRRSSDDPGIPGEDPAPGLTPASEADDPARHAITGPLGDPPDVDADFVHKVRTAIEMIREENREANAESEARRKREKYLNDLDKRLNNYKGRLGLTDAQVADLNALAGRAVDERREAQEAGATGAELSAMDRETARVSQGLMGVETYREFRKLEFDRAARPVIVDAAGKAGVDQNQRDRIESLLSQHIEKVVDWDVRVRTEDMEPEERNRVLTEYRAANRDVWDRLRADILTEEQRNRVPVRLR